MRVLSAALRRVFMPLILVAGAALLQGCDTGSPAGPSVTPPPPTAADPASVTLALADPSRETLPPGGGSAVLIATVSDAAGNRLANTTVTFSVSAGVLSAGVVTTDASGQARTTLTTGRETVVTAAAGDRTAMALTIRVARSERLSLNVLTAPAQPRAGVDAVTFIASVSVDPGVSVERIQWRFGDGSAVIETREDQTTHTYREPGLRMITVTVKLSNGYMMASARSIDVLPATMR